MSVRVNRRKLDDTGFFCSSRGDPYYRAVISPSGDCWDMLTEYTECEQVGKGSYGEVVKARSKSKGLVAIKKVEILEDNHHSDWENGVRLVREIFFLKNLKHPNLSSLMGLFSNNITSKEGKTSSGSSLTTVHIVTKYFGQGSLSEYAPACLEEVLSIQLQVMEGLKYLHAHEVIHRDIKRENIFVDASLSGGKKVHVVIGDFGLSRSLVYSAMTSEVVTKPYRCPSLLLGATQYGPEIDVFAAGLVLMEMLTGKCNSTILPNKKMGLRNFLRFQIAVTRPCEDRIDMLSTRICDLADRMHVDLFELLESVRGGTDFEARLALEWGVQAWELVSSKYAPPEGLLKVLGRMIDFDPCARIDVKSVIENPVFDLVRKRPLRLASNQKITVRESFDRDIAALSSEEQKADAVKQAIWSMIRVDDATPRFPRIYN